MARRKYNIGELVYSYQNPTKKFSVSMFREGKDGFPNKYKLSLRDKDGFSKSSNWIDEKSLYKTKKKSDIKKKANMKKTKVKKPTIAYIKSSTMKDSPYFFESKTLKFFGQRQSSFKVHVTDSGRIFIYAPAYSNDYRTGKKVRMKDTVREYIPNGVRSKLKFTSKSLSEIKSM